MDQPQNLDSALFHFQYSTIQGVDHISFQLPGKNCGELDRYGQ